MSRPKIPFVSRTMMLARASPSPTRISSTWTRRREVVSRSYNTSNNEKDYSRGNASLEVNINSNVIGKAHIAWQSKDMMPDYMGRHATYSRATEDLTGVFNIEKFIQLWSNSTLGSVSLNWLPCS